MSAKVYVLWAEDACPFPPGFDPFRWPLRFFMSPRLIYPARLREAFGRFAFPAAARHCFLTKIATLFSAARSLLAPIMPLEDLRQRINPIRVLHDAITLSGIAAMGPIMPMCSNIDERDHAAVASAASSLMAAESELASRPAAE